MTEYKVGRWYPWSGGDCPVPYDSVVKTVRRNTGAWDPMPATLLEWGHDISDPIVAFVICQTISPEYVSLTICRQNGASPITLTGTMKITGGKPDLSTWEES